MSKFDEERVEAVLEAINKIASGDQSATAPTSAIGDELDAIALGINVFVAELRYQAKLLREAKLVAERASSAKTQFLRTVSHEIRTPIAVILGLSQQLAQPNQSPEETQRLVARLGANGRTLLGLVEGVLDLAKIEAGQLDLVSTEFSPVEMVRDVLVGFGDELKRKGLSSEVLVADGFPNSVRLDEGRVRQIVVNLVSNAIKFTSVGGVRVRLSRSAEQRLILDVEDSGIGIEQEKYSELFQPFSRAHAGDYAGVGLGLDLSRQLARRMGGDVCLVTSEPKRGSHFRLFLPASVAPHKTASTPKAQSRSLASMKLLVADDNEDILSLIRQLLESEGAIVQAVHNGKQALSHAQVEEFDAILLDVRMPVMDGLSVARTLRQSGNRTPIVAITADATVEHQRECLAAGCSGYVTKPFLADRLVGFLSSLIPSPALMKSG